MYVCICNGVTEHDIRKAAAAGCSGMTELTMRTGCGATCGSCVSTACGMLEEERAVAVVHESFTVVAFPRIADAA